MQLHEMAKSTKEQNKELKIIKRKGWVPMHHHI